MSRQAVALAGRFNPQEEANLMWAFATLGLDPGLDLALVFTSFLYTVASSHQDNLRQELLCQLHQCFLCMELEGFLHGAGNPSQQQPALADRCRRAFEAGPTHASGLEHAVRRRLSVMGAGWMEGVREPRTGYSLDLVLEGSAGPMALEVDGPTHFLSPISGSRTGPRHREQGATRLKRRLLERAGWRVESVRFWEWDAAAARGAAAISPSDAGAIACRRSSA